MEPWQIIVIVFAAVIHLCASGLMLYHMFFQEDGFALSPKEIKDFHDLTWFGAMCVFMLCLILFTYVYLIVFIYLLFKGHWPEEFE